MPEKNSLNGNDVINDDSPSNREDELRKLFYALRRDRRSSDSCFCDDDYEDEDDNDGLE